jgi:hypothetical protein
VNIIYYCQQGKSRTLNQPSLWEWGWGEKQNPASGNVARNKCWEKGWGKKPTSQSGSMMDHWANLCGGCTKLNCPTLLGEMLTRQSCVCGVIQLLSGKKSNLSDHLGQSGSKQSQTLLATCHLDRRNQLLLKSQPSGKTTTEILCTPDDPSDQVKQN